MGEDGGNLGVLRSELAQVVTVFKMPRVPTEDQEYPGSWVAVLLMEYSALSLNGALNSPEEQGSNG